MIYSGHEGHLDDIAVTVEAAYEALNPFKHKFDFIAVTGMSGALIGAPASIMLRRPLVVVRKESDMCHSYGTDLINQFEANGAFLILDDFISCGSTYRRLRERFEEPYMAERTRYAGCYLYSSQTLSWDGDGPYKSMLIKPGEASSPGKIMLKDFWQQLPSTPPVPPGRPYSWELGGV